MQSYPINREELNIDAIQFVYGNVLKKVFSCQYKFFVENSVSVQNINGLARWNWSYDLLLLRKLEWIVCNSCFLFKTEYIMHWWDVARELKTFQNEHL